MMKIRVECRSLPPSTKKRFLRAAEYLLFVGGTVAIGYCMLVYFEARVYESFEAPRFENPLGTAPAYEFANRFRIMPQDGSPVSRIEIPRIGVSVLVVEGVGTRSLTLGVGHVPGTALPGQIGNIGIAGHRDTFFRNLNYIHGRDTITLITARGAYKYSVESTEIVDPSDVEVLDPSSEPVLTLITCYPFRYVGPAPKRFIVRARQIGGLETSRPLP